MKIAKFSTVIMFISFCLIFLLTTSTLSKEDNFFYRVGEDVWAGFTAPKNMRGEDWFKFSLFTTVTISLIANDQQIHDGVEKFRNRNPSVDKVGPRITVLGEGLYDLAFFGLIGGSGYFFKNEKAKETGCVGFEALTATGFWTQLAKFIFSRERPGNPTVPGGKWWWFDFEHDAFPSGHTASVFATATVIAEQYKEHQIVPIIAYSLATCAGLSRMTKGAHWASDVLVGAAIGYLSARQALKKK